MLWLSDGGQQFLTRRYEIDRVVFYSKLRTCHFPFPLWLRYLNIKLFLKRLWIGILCMACLKIMPSWLEWILGAIVDVCWLWYDLTGAEGSRVGNYDDWWAIGLWSFFFALTVAWWISIGARIVIILCLDEETVLAFERAIAESARLNALLTALSLSLLGKQGLFHMGGQRVDRLWDFNFRIVWDLHTLG